MHSNLLTLFVFGNQHYENFVQLMLPTSRMVPILLDVLLLLNFVVVAAAAVGWQSLLSVVDLLLYFVESPDWWPFLLLQLSTRRLLDERVDVPGCPSRRIRYCRRVQRMQMIVMDAWNWNGK